MRILVTGSSGSIGKKLVEILEKKEYQVFLYDISIGQDLLNKKQLEDVVKNTDVVYHYFFRKK